MEHQDRAPAWVDKDAIVTSEYRIQQGGKVQGDKFVKVIAQVFHYLVFHLGCIFLFSAISSDRINGIGRMKEDILEK